MPGSATVVDQAAIIAALIQRITALERATSQPPVTVVSAQLNSVTSKVNTRGKATGTMVFNEENNEPVWAANGLPIGIWVRSNGTTAHTPV